MNKHFPILIAVGLLAASVLTGCETTPTQQGALMGGALGAGAGAIIGNQNHHRSGEGALIGAGVGALTGALIGDATSQNQQPRQQVVEQPTPVQRGHWETQTVRTQAGETYEQRVWVQER